MSIIDGMSIIDFFGTFAALFGTWPITAVAPARRGTGRIAQGFFQQVIAFLSLYDMLLARHN